MVYSFIVGKIIEAHIERDEKKMRACAELLAQHYEDDGEVRAAHTIRSKLDGSYKNMAKVNEQTHPAT